MNFIWHTKLGTEYYKSYTINTNINIFTVKCHIGYANYSNKDCVFYLYLNNSILFQDLMKYPYYSIFSYNLIKKTIEDFIICFERKNKINNLLVIK